MTVSRLKNVGIAGLGKMGSAIARNLLDRGYRVSAWNRTRAAVDELAPAGAVACETPEALIAGADAVVAMLWDDAVAREITLGRIIPSAREGQLILESSTLSPQMYQTLAHAAEERGVDFLACPVVGSVDSARTGSLTIFPGGSTTALEHARELLAAMGSTVTFSGSPVASGFLKLASNVHAFERAGSPAARRSRHGASLLRERAAKGSPAREERASERKRRRRGHGLRARRLRKNGPTGSRRSRLYRRRARARIENGGAYDNSRGD
jgi:hypothetical protein